MSKEKDYLKMVEGSTNAWGRLPPMLRQIKDDALSILLNSLDELFSSCDDLFFDLSSRAASNAEQNLYFESMRELRVKKAGVINNFRQHYEQGFLILAHAQTAFGNNSGELDDAFSITDGEQGAQSTSSGAGGRVPVGASGPPIIGRRSRVPSPSRRGIQHC